jgi:hypothetical protein
VGPTRGWRRLGNRPPAPTGRARHESGAGGWATQQAENGGKEGAGRGSRAAPRKSQQAARGEKKGGGGGKGGRARVGGGFGWAAGAPSRPKTREGEKGEGEGEGQAAAGPRQGNRPKRGGLGVFSYFLFSYNLLLSAYFMETKQLHRREIDVWLGMMQQPKKIFLGFTHTRFRAKSR